MDLFLKNAPTQFFSSQNIIILPSSKDSDLRFILEKRLNKIPISENSSNIEIKSSITQYPNSLNETMDKLSEENSSIITQSDTGGLLQEIINKKYESKQKLFFLKKKRKELKKMNMIKKIEEEKEKELLNKSHKEKMNIIRNKFYKTSFKFYIEKDKINVTYKYQNESKNYLFFFCSLKPDCPGTCKINKLTSKVEITNNCDPNIDHNILSFEEFNSLCENKNLDKIDFTNHKYQSMYVTYIIKNNMDIQNNELLELFKLNTGKILNLKNSEITCIRNKAINSLNDLNVEDIIAKIYSKNGDINIVVKTLEEKYQKDEYNDKLKKKILMDKIGKIIFFGDKNMVIYLNDKNIDEYYFDTSFKIIQKKMQFFKFLIISGYDTSDNAIKICAYIFIEHPDINSYYNVFKYLNEEYNFNPKKIFHDYDEDLINALDKEYLFKQKPIKKYCFFYYEKILRNKCKIISPSRKNINLSCLELIINILILSFINRDKINEMKKIIFDKCRKTEECLRLFEFLDKNFISKFINEINISKIIYLNYNDYKANINQELKQFYEIKNRCELINITLEHFLPRYPINTNIFINKFRTLFSNNNTIIKYEKNNIKQRYDFNIQTLLYIIQENKINENPNWINVELYLNTLIKIIKENNDINDDKIVDEVMKEINYWNIIYYSDKNIEKLLDDDNDDLFETRKNLDSEEGDNDNVFSLDCIKDLGKINSKNKKNYQASKKVDY